MARKPTTTGGPRKRAPAVQRAAPGVAVPETAASLPPPTRKPIWTHLYFQVLVAIGLGALIGHFWPVFGESLKPLGDAFIRLVKMIIAPVIFLTVPPASRTCGTSASWARWWARPSPIS